MDILYTVGLRALKYRPAFLNLRNYHSHYLSSSMIASGEQKRSSGDSPVKFTVI